MSFGTTSDVSIFHEPAIEPLMVEIYFLFVSFGVRIASAVEDLDLDLAGGDGRVSRALEVSAPGSVGGWYGGLMLPLQFV
jgi:hypothetical protein